MTYYPSVKPDQGSPSRVVAGIMLLSWLVLGNGGLGVASETRSQLEINGDSITGVLMQVPLRAVLEELREKLAIEFVVPEQELEKPVSGNFVGEPLGQILSKILASWDYALRVDQEGRVQKIFVVAPIGPIGMEPTPTMAAGPKVAVVSKTRTQQISHVRKPKVLIAANKMGSSPERGELAFPGLLKISEKPHPMRIQSAQGTPMSIQPSSNFMQVIPASGYPPMDIFPVSDEAQWEFIEGQN